MQLTEATVVETLWLLTSPAVCVCGGRLTEADRQEVAGGGEGGEVAAATVVEMLWPLPLLLLSVSVEAD